MVEELSHKRSRATVAFAESHDLAPSCGSVLHIRLFGGIEIRCSDARVPCLAARRSQSLRVYLALHQDCAPKSWCCVNPGGTDSCYSTIQAAINASSHDAAFIGHGRVPDGTDFGSFHHVYFAQGNFRASPSTMAPLADEGDIASLIAKGASAFFDPIMDSDARVCGDSPVAVLR